MFKVIRDLLKYDGRFRVACHFPGRCGHDDTFVVCLRPRIQTKRL